MSSGTRSVVRSALALGLTSVFAVLVVAGVFSVELRAACHRRLVLAARSGDQSVVRALLALGVDDAGVWATPALWVAASEGRDELVELLLEHHSPIDARAKGNGTPLEAAVVGRHESTVLLLLRHGANPHGAGSYLPLTSSALSCQPTVVAALLRAHGDDPNLATVVLNIAGKSCPAVAAQFLVNVSDNEGP